MASIGHDGKGRRILVVLNEKRKTIRLGKVSERTAIEVCGHVEKLAIVAQYGGSIPPATAAWLNERGDKLRHKLERAGIIEPTEPAPAKVVPLGDFVKGYIEKRLDIKPGTKTCLELVKDRMFRYFGEDRDIASITEQDAEDFKQYLVGKEKYAENTARRTIAVSRQFFRAAVRGRLLAANPFDGIPVSLKEVRTRHIFLNHADSMKVLESCPDSQWRLIFALCRWGGLRCPSEVLSLKWEHIDWDLNRITITSPKTERHEGHDSRLIPLFPELLGPLQDVYDEAPEGAEWVITKYRLDNTNLRTQFQRILVQAGIKPWPKPFQNLRSTRETELLETHPIHVVCAWIGNSVLIAKKSYLQIRDEDFDKACPKTVPPQSKKQKVARNPAQIMDDDSRKYKTMISGDCSQVLNDSGFTSNHQESSRMARKRGVGVKGFEPSASWTQTRRSNPS